MRQREVGGNSCKRILNINKLYEASVKKKRGFSADREGVPSVSPPPLLFDSKIRGVELARISYKW